MANTAVVSLLVLLLLAFLLCCSSLPENGTDGKAVAFHFPAVFAFGDSILDTGNNNVLATISKCNFPPYGKDFVGHQPTGRFSNGKVPSDMIASTVGLKELLPPYLTTTQSDELLTGVSFASGGTGYDPLTAKTLSILSMADQLKLFKEYEEKLVTIAGQGKADEIIAKSLYLVCAGSNDVANTYFVSPLRRLQYDVPLYLNFLVQSASSFVQDLHHLGARKIGVVGLPPLGCLPSQKTMAWGARGGGCVLHHNEVSMAYNQILSSELQALRGRLPGATVVYIDIYATLLNMVQSPYFYGFEEASKGCCGTGLIETSILCNNFTSSTCQDDSKFVFWDSFHPTERAYEILVRYVKDNYLPLLQ